MVPQLDVPKMCTSCPRAFQKVGKTLKAPQTAPDNLSYIDLVRALQKVANTKNAPRTRSQLHPD